MRPHSRLSGGKASQLDRIVAATGIRPIAAFALHRARTAGLAGQAASRRKEARGFARCRSGRSWPAALDDTATPPRKNARLTLLPLKYKARHKLCSAHGRPRSPIFLLYSRRRTAALRVFIALAAVPARQRSYAAFMRKVSRSVSNSYATTRRFRSSRTITGESPMNVIPFEPASQSGKSCAANGTDFGKLAAGSRLPSIRLPHIRSSMRCPNRSCAASMARS